MTTNDDVHPESPATRATARAASAAKDGIDAADAGANRVLDKATTKLGEARDRVVPAVAQGIDQAGEWVDEQAGRLRDGIQVGRDRMNDLTDQVLDYTRDEPARALLIAAAVGAGLMGLLALLVRSDD